MASETAVRRPAVAGRFYAADPRALRREVDDLLASAEPGSPPVPKAVIAPHAGFMFSGPVAAAAYRRLEPAAGRIARVVVIGPSHFHPVRGVAAPGATAFATPLGDVPVDRDGLETALAQPGVITDDAAHRDEHSLETQLPFIQRVLGDVAIVPLVVGSATAEEVGRTLAALWGGAETAVAVSSDLSHFHPDTEARALDARTVAIIEALKGEELGPENACGFLPIAGLLWHAGRHGGRIRTLQLANSADAGAPPERVVGYGAFEYAEAAA
ncbi:AmmeMemoRadiSam system protein B [Aquisalimonas lutea]|uniref:AmmeMemoRadiSam system protein B n=1 Tax=Aquisalimonas lutea TaxID=1327750 RepID=UPI0025B43070|nr:AmmeMemoRadiSam system protein B [Aquisalimonas lutea]MDN3518484.1 AmmeMemoRadiSam system protein B [Aquisalimonas lutea]